MPSIQNLLKFCNLLFPSVTGEILQFNRFSRESEEGKQTCPHYIIVGGVRRPKLLRFRAHFERVISRECARFVSPGGEICKQLVSRGGSGGKTVLIIQSRVVEFLDCS